MAAEELARRFGPIDLTSDVMAFDLTHYYDRQMGSPLWRQFVAMANLVSPEFLTEAKTATNAVEEDFAARFPPPPDRPVNLDVGYVASSKLVLASMKNFSHRVYLGGGVYAEVTLRYHREFWQAFEWTFPDYASGRYRPFLDATRLRLRQQLSQESCP